MPRATPIAALLLLVAGCTVDELQLEDRWCDPDYPCASGYACVSNQCSASSTDAPGPAPDLRAAGRPGEPGPAGERRPRPGR